MIDGALLTLLPVLIPVVAGSYILTRGDDPGRARSVGPVAMLSVLITLPALALVSAASPQLTLPLGRYMTIHMGPDPMGLLFAWLASLLWVLTVLYSLGYMPRGKEGRARFFGYLILSQASVLGIALSRNILTLYFFYEALTLLTYPLVTQSRTPRAMEAGRLYIVYSLIGAALVLGGGLALQSIYGELTFTPGGALGPGTPAGMAPILVALILGFGVKAAVMPGHGWLPRAMVAPTPVSALLHAVAVVKAGVFGVIRVTYSIFGPEALHSTAVVNWLSALLLITIVVASAMALRQDVLKRRLAYSTISQLAYISMGALLLTPHGLSGALLHMVNHAVLKIILFFSAGVIMTGAGVDKVSQLRGIGRRFPVTMCAFTVASLGLVGVLPTNGFVSKWHLFAGCLEAGMVVPAVVLLISALLTALYLLPICIRAFLTPGEFQPQAGLEAPGSMIAPVTALAVAAILLGLYPYPLIEAMRRVAGSLMGAAGLGGF